MQIRIQKWGNSMGLRSPRSLAEQIGLGAGSAVNLSAKDGELLAEVSDSNRHSSVETGTAVGAEIF
jgi:antitoxin MazE